MFTIDIDVGGTFTDGYMSDGVEARTAKVLTTPHDIAECITNCVEAGADIFSQPLANFLRNCSVARISTTVGTNLLIQRGGPKIGLLVTKGAEDNLYGQHPAGSDTAFISPGSVIGLAESVDDDGRVEVPVDKEEVLAGVRQLLEQGARMIVVSFRNAWINATNEHRVVEYVKDRYPVHYLRSIPIQLATEVVHVADDHVRTNSAILNAYIHSDMARSLYRAEDELREAALARPLLVVHASGGNARIAKTIALHTLNSGPAACATGAAAIARRKGLERVVTGDMGGTSFDVAVIKDGVPALDPLPSMFGMQIGIPALRATSLGGGGGSIARLDGDTIQVGPASAGGAPGPVCYDKGGTEPTVTDADVVLGYIDPDFFLGGRMRLRKDLAARAIGRRVADPMGISVTEAALRIRHSVAHNLAGAMVSLLQDDGCDASAFTFFAMGGAGPLHACEIAELAGIGNVIGFPFGSVFSAFGSCMTDLRHTYVRSLPAATGDNTAAIEAIVTELKSQAIKDMQGEGFDENAVGISVELDVAGDGKSGTQVRLSATCATPRPSLAEHDEVGADAAFAAKGYRDISWSADGASATAIYDREKLRPGNTIEGPTLVEGDDTVYAVPLGWRLTVDTMGCFVITSSES